MVEEIRDILRPHARLAVDVDALSPAADLFEAGMTSHSSVVVMLALEEHFDVHFPDEMLTREVFHSMESIQRALADLRGRRAA